MVSHLSSALAPDTHCEITNSWFVCRIRCRRYAAGIGEVPV
jgi:hypothetical protein